MADVALEKSRGEGRREMAKPISVAGSARTWSRLRRRMREDDEKNSDVV